MSFKLNFKKPIFDLNLPSLCNFRTSKAYLWGLIRQELFLLQKKSSNPLLCLDAACHALITRDMFPIDSLYYGLDISPSRLSSASRNCRDHDTLYLADLAQDLPLESCFDVVVSCNTLSHVNLEIQPAVFSNLISFCRPNGDMFINTCVGPGMSDLASALNTNFSTVRPIYFESTVSVSSEDAQSVFSSNVNSLLPSHEFDIPNEAIFHRQVLFHAHNKLATSGLIKIPPSSSNGELITLSSLPCIRKCSYVDDNAMISDFAFWKGITDVLITSRLFESPACSEFINFLDSQSIDFQLLTSSIDALRLGRNIVIIGLELSWTHSQAEDRLAINRLRSLEGIVITFALVSYRAGSKCTPSLVVSDA